MRLPRTENGSAKPHTGHAVVARRWLADARGIAALEFGLLAAPIFLTLYAIFNIGLFLYMERALDHAALVGGRAIATGAVGEAGLSRTAFMNKYICPALGGSFTCSNVFIQLSTVTAGQSPSGFNAFVNATKSGLNAPNLSNKTNVYNVGVACQYMVLQLIYPATFPFSLFIPAAPTEFQGQPVKLLTSQAAFKTEPYSGASSTTGCQQ